jgi:U3 small nucleolar RNA-associated protein 7
VAKYARGSVNFRGAKSAPKKLRKTLAETQSKISEAANAAADAEILLPATPGFVSMGPVKTFKLKQTELAKHVDLNTAKNIVDFHLPNFGPYKVSYSRNGRL